MKSKAKEKNNEIETKIFKAYRCHRPESLAVVHFKMADKEDTWNKFKNAMKQKRTGKKQGTTNDPRQNKEEIVVQRLSADVTGKAQKYLRIGPREFVQIGVEDELTIEKIKVACLKHFAPQIGSNLVCDVLAGEKGPSCLNIKQVPDLKLIYVRFISDRSCVYRSNIGGG